MISIVMPIKNGLPFLEECLDSILYQTYKEWELLAVNDHSTDNTLQTLVAYQQKDKRIIPINNNGNGIIDALQTGYSQTQGNYITRMDADDRMPNNKLQLLLNCLVDNPHSQLAMGKVAYFSTNKNLGEGYQKYADWLNHLIDNNAHYEEIYKECTIPSCGWLMSKQDFERCGGFDSLVYPEDYDLCFRFYQHNITIATTNQIVHYWRDHESRTSRNSEVYCNNSFIPLKVNNFISIDKKMELPLILIGAGKKGKSIAKLLQQKNHSFIWLTNNKAKQGHSIYGITLQDEHNYLNNVSTPVQAIIAIASPKEQEQLKKYLAKISQIETFWMC